MHITSRVIIPNKITTDLDKIELDTTNLEKYSHDNPILTFKITPVFQGT